MRAFVVTAPHQGQVVDVGPPAPAADEVVVDIQRVGLCGTDVELFTGEMPYLAQGLTAYPLQLGHEWCGVVSAVGAEVDGSWVGRRVTGDTMIGCGHCERCAAGRINVCEQRREIGIRGMADTAGALVEPGSSALRAVLAAELGPGRRLLVLGTGTIGLLVAELARAQGAEVHLAGEDERTLALAGRLGFAGVWRPNGLPELSWGAVVDATNAPGVPARALDLVEPGGRLVFIGLAGSPSLVDTRAMVFKDLTAVGILAGSQGMSGTIERYAAGDVDPRPLVAATVGLERVADVLAGWRPDDAGPGPKIHIDPRG
jgi:2-desacetyl-2-hydroxyethyl bacteriochlorophyllide A dehydrogenase